VVIEQTGYNRDLPDGQTTGFRLIPIFNPVTLAVDLIKAVPQGIDQMQRGLRGEPTWIVPRPPETLMDDDNADSATAQRVSSAAETEAVESEPASSEPVSEDAEPVATDDQTVDTKDETKVKPAKNPFSETERGLRDFDRIHAALHSRSATRDKDDKTSDDEGSAPESSTDQSDSQPSKDDTESQDNKTSDAPKSDDKATEKAYTAA
jgi:hypothetical protein